MSTCVVSWQELILAKVKEDELVRAKISQSSALRPKRGHTDANERLDLQDSGALAGPNNNIVDTRTEKNGIIHSNGTSVESNIACREVTSDSSTKEEEEEESITTGSLSEISKFESKAGFCPSSPPTGLHTLISDWTSITAVCLVPSPDLSFQPDEHLEVYVSAYENPNHFWIQILGVRSLQLDKLTEEMTRFYGSSCPVRTTAVTTTDANTPSQVKIIHRALCKNESVFKINGVHMCLCACFGE